MVNSEFGEIISWVLKVLVVPLAIAIIKGRDMVLEGQRQSLENKKRIEQNRIDIEELNEKRSKDLLEYHSVLTFVKSLDTLVDQKLSPYFHTASEQRHRDNEELTKTFTALQVTLKEMVVEMKYMRKDVDEIKSKNNEK